MKKKTIRRIATLGIAAVISAGAVAMFTGCSSDHPEVTITYSFLGKDYEVQYTLSRKDAPQTVQHFIELADAGFYDGTCIHDYEANFLYGGGYKIVDEDGKDFVYGAEGNGDKTFELSELDYFAFVTEKAANGTTFTQSVFTNDSARDGLYTVYGEFEANGYKLESRENRHSRGALVMYYTDKSESAKNVDVTVPRRDGGKVADTGNGSSVVDPYQKMKYANNSATSLFYTFCGDSNVANDNAYAVFGKTKNYMKQLQPLLNEISDYISKHYSEDEETTEEEEYSFTTKVDWVLDTLDHTSAVFGEEIGSKFESVQKGGKRETYNTPLEQPIIIKSVKVNKY